ncbi:MAG: hypothetical protein ACYDHM_02635 [Acidiferrobacterales bacterium]
MTLAGLLQYLDSNTPFAVLDGSPEETLSKALDGRHSDPLAGRIINSIAEGNHCIDEHSPVNRAESVTALGPLRLQYMKDDAPVDGFRMMERIIHAIDGAFNDEALRQKSR